MSFEWVTRKDERVEAVVVHPGLSRQVRLMAENIRDQQTGVHAHVTVGYGDPQNGRFDLIEDDTFNLGRMKERNALANAAAEGLVMRHNKETPEEGRISPDMRGAGKPFAQTMRTWMRDFCGDAWTQHVGHYRAEWRAGSEEPHPPRWILRPWALEDAGTILFGPRGGTKSYTVLLWAMMVTHGISGPLGEVEHSMPVLFVNLERPTLSLDDRVANVAQVLGLPRTTTLPRIDARGHTMRDVAPAIHEFVKEHEKECVVALDGLSRAVTGSLKDDDEANGLMNMMNSFSVPWWAIAHQAKTTPKGESPTPFGSGMFENAPDVLVQLSPESRGQFRKVVALQTTKQNDTPPSGRRTFVFDFEEQQGLVAFDQLAKDQAGDVGKGPEWVLRDRIMMHLKRHGRQTYKQLSVAMRVTERSISAAIRGDDRFGRTSSRPVEIYMPERPVDGSRKQPEFTSMSTSASPLDPSHSDVDGVGGTPPTGGGSNTSLPSNTSSENKTKKEEENENTSTSDSTTCWHCGNTSEIAARDAEGQAVCDQCVEAVMDGPMDQD